MAAFRSSIVSGQVVTSSSVSLTAGPSYLGTVSAVQMFSHMLIGRVLRVAPIYLKIGEEIRDLRTEPMSPVCRAFIMYCKGVCGCLS